MELDRKKALYEYSINLAQEYINNAGNDWITVTARYKDSYSALAKLEDTQSVRVLGPIIAIVLKRKYNFYSAEYCAKSNSISLKSKN